MEGVLFANIAAAAATFAVLLFRKFFKDKVFSGVFVLLWMAIIIRLLLPFEFSSAISIYPYKDSPSAYREINVQAPAEQIPIYIDIEPEKPTEIPAAKPNKTEISSAELIFAAWVFGGISCIGYFSGKHIYSVRKIMKNALPFDELPADIPLGKIPVYQSEKISSPLSFGFFRPVIVIPKGTSSGQLSFVLLHEQTHIKNRDAVLKLIGIFALSANWFNPFAWIAVKYLDRDLERLCDEKVLSALGTEKSADYANTILDFAEKESLSLSFFSAAPLSERIVSIMKNKNKKARPFAVLCLFAAVIITMSACGTVPKEPAEKTDSEELLELIKNANWKPLDEQGDVAYIDVHSDTLGDFSIMKSDLGEEDENIALSWNFTDLPVERIVIKDLGLSENVVTDVWCMKAHWENIGIDNYEKLLECGFKVEYNNGEIVISTKEPIGDKISEFHISFHIDLEETEIISENINVQYFGMPNLNEEYSQEKHAELIQYLDRIEDYQEFVYVAETPNVDKTPVEIRDENNREEAKKSTISFLWPCEEKFISSDAENYETHPGIDIGNKAGSAIYAAADGEVFFVDDTFPGFGKSIAIDHGDSFSTFYGSCSEIYVEQFDKVKAGDLIARTGSTENTGEPHLHFELRKGKTQLNPIEFLPVPDTSYLQSLIKEVTELGIEFIRPVDGGYVCCELWGYKGHVGTDYMPENGHGSDIFAVADGTVVKVKNGNTGYGKYIILDHGDSVHTVYAHCADLFVKVGDEVKTGDVIASVGSTGNSTGTHLHFELRYKGFYLDPEKYLPET